MKQISDNIQKKMLLILQEFLEEMGAERALKRLSTTADLESDLGIDSLGRIEFIHRAEEVFGCKLPASVFAQVQNIEDLAAQFILCAPQELLPKFVENIIEEENTPHIPRGRTLIDSFLLGVKHVPERVHIYLTQEDGSEKSLTYRELHRQALHVAAGLVTRGLKPQETVAIMLPTSEDFFVGFLGVMLAGGIPVPIYPPFRPSHIEEYILREATLLKNAKARFLITFTQAETLSYLLQGLIPHMKEVLTVDKLKLANADFKPAVVLPSDAAFIQYTSGSTGNPKGVLLTHANILANLNAAGEAIAVSPEDRIVSWLPLYHDMGLIGFWFGSLYFNLPLAVMSPLNFISRPESWLWSLHNHKGTLSAAPNFAYELCIRRIKDKDIEGLDLSSVRLLMNGAEAVQPHTLQMFIEKFKPYGFKPESMFPVYGLAESTVALAFPPLDRKEPRIDVIDRNTLETRQIAEKAKENDSMAYRFVACGKAIPGHEMKIVSEDGKALPDRTVGRLLFRGPSSMQGYYNNPEATAKIYHNGWLDSGDFAYMAEGDVFITGRTKDVIIKAGKNIYPDDIEEISGHIPGVRKGRVIAFGVNDKRIGTERLVVVAETFETDQKEKDKIASRITEKLVTTLGLPADEIIMARPGTIPKTSSGKLQRSACKADYLAGRINKKSMPVWIQLARISLRSFFQRSTNAINELIRYIYTAYVALWAIPFILIALPLIAVPNKKYAQIIARFVLRTFFRVCFVPIKMIDKHYLTKANPVIFVANHSSYLDALIMTAILPAGVAAVSKREVASFKPFKWLLEKLGHITVERQDITQSLSDLKRMEAALRSKVSLMIFPEGTFFENPGLLPFKSGAFKLSVDTSTPICPIAINGARAMLPDGRMTLKPGCLTITAYPPIYPESGEWSEVLRMNAMAREEIAKGCGENIFDTR